MTVSGQVVKLFIHPGKEGDISLPSRSLKDFRLLRQERELCLRMGQHIFWTKSGQAALTICLTFFLYCVRSLYSLYSILKNHQGGLIVTSVKSLVRSDRKIFTADRSDSECRRSRRLDPPSVPPAVPRSSFPRPNRPDTLPDFLSDPGPSIGLPCHSSLNGSVVPFAMSYL